MPEIAEVETVRRTLKKQILQKQIAKVSFIYPNIITSDKKEFQTLLVGQSFVDIKRIGKWLLFETENYYLLSHLRMEGKFFLKHEKDPIAKHEHIIITFKDKSDLRYHDTRKFGRMMLTKKELLYEIPAIAKQGREPLDESLTASYLYDKIHSKNVAIKTLLLDQTIISGLGNIYANEVLWQSEVNPWKKGSKITKKECERIIASSRIIIEKAIESGGTTIRSYTSSLGVTGRFQQHLHAHRKKDKPCSRCGTLIVCEKINGRSTYYCPKCQG